MKSLLSNTILQTGLVLSFLIFTLTAHAQEGYYVGFKKALRGTNFSYHSPYSYSDQCLLQRAKKDFEPVVWETEVVPPDYKGESISFIWLYGMDVLPESQDFKFFINDNYILTFSNPIHNSEAGIWEVAGENNVRLTFNRAMIDKHGDQMGYAVLTLPTSIAVPGKSVILKVDGEDNFSNAWYMTYKIPLEDQFSAKQLNTVTRENDQLYHTIRFNLVHLAPKEKAMISVDGTQKEVQLKTGLNEIDFLIPKVEASKTVNTKVAIGKKMQEETITVAPVKEWTIHLVQHTHTDIGYTRPQSEILAEHLRYIDHVLDYCDQTDHLPKNAQFRWTCEASWAVREYLDSRPQEQIDRLLQRIKEGRVEVTGMFFNFGEIVDETALAMQTHILSQFKKQGINVTTAMQNDVNGIGWCMIDLYHNTGVKYLTMGQHGHRARIPFNKPTSFWWESPSGKRLLAYRSEHYMHGNTLSLTSGKIDVFRDNLSAYLLDLERKEYPLDRVSLQFSGYITDNSPPSTKACDIVREWNEKYEWPKLKLSLASEFMIFLEENHSDHLETKQVAWPDWWADGFGSAMNETKTARTTHVNMIATLGLLSMSRALGADIPNDIYAEIEACYDNLLFYDEHTFGADESISNPFSENSINQWRQKLSYVWSANQQANLLQEKAFGLIQPYIEKTDQPVITVFNTLNWARSGVTEVFIDHDILPLDREFEIIDREGNKIPAQNIKSRSDGSWWALWVKEVPALGFAQYEIRVSDEPLNIKKEQVPIKNTFENDYYKIVIDERENGISSLFDKELNKELIDVNHQYSLGSFIYELLENRSDLERLTHLNQDTVYQPLNKKMLQLTDFKITKVEKKAIWNSLYCHGKLPECANDQGINIELRLYNHAKKIELLYNLTKTANTDPEGVYIAFPFENDDDGQLVFEVQGGVVRPGINQLEGTASDWNTIQNFASVRKNNSQVVFCSNDVPLVQFGDINIGRYYYRHQPNNGHIYSWVLNNYWTTNFRASQHGELNWKYQITSSSDNSTSFATRFGWGNRIPMVARVYPQKSENSTTPVVKSVLDLNAPENLLLVNSRPLADGKGILLHLRETEGDHAILDITKLLQHPNIASIAEVNGLGEDIKTLTAPLLIEHFETKLILLKMRD